LHDNRTPGRRLRDDEGDPRERLAPPKRIDNWSLTSLQQRLVKTGGRLVKHARYYRLLLAESHLTRRLRRNRPDSKEAGDGEVYEKSFEMRHFRVFRARTRQSRPPPGPPKSVGVNT
jgi:hypothetical protein